VIAVSSFRAFSEASQIAFNQMRAFQSWLPVFDRVFYFGAPERRLSSPKTVFVASPDFPSIKLLMQMAAIVSEPACIINADIVLDPKAHTAFYNTMRRYQAATSFRLEFNSDTRQARRVDNGLDAFIAHPAVWQRCWPIVPNHFRIGHPCWDSWLNAWLRDQLGVGYADLSAQKLVFHPNHKFREKRTHAPLQP
jgi:hypothetical protein